MKQRFVVPFIVIVTIRTVHTIVTTTDAFPTTSTVLSNNKLRQQCRSYQRGNGRIFIASSTATLTSPSPDESSPMNGLDNHNVNDNKIQDETVVVPNKVHMTSAKDGDAKIEMTKQQQRMDYIRSEGGQFSFHTKYGALNPFAIYYGMTSILLGLPWFVALTLYQFVQFITLGRFDKLRRIPVHLNQLWGESLLVLTRCYPEMIHRDILQKFYQEYVLKCFRYFCRLLF
jgi:hypothetical protein